jgi:serine/threonine protein kinase
VHSPLVDLLAGALGPGYTIERELQGGGMSRVFVAFDQALQRRVAVKVLPEHLAAAVSVDRFDREILLSAGLQHPNIVPVLSAGAAGGLPFFTMPYVDGESVAGRLAQQGPLTVRETVSILKDVSRALAYAHERGIVHRDIKPHNILLSARAATVTDFGVAKAISSARRSAEHERAGTLTGTGTSLGTPLYMAPEQAAADPDVDHRADIYALGITAYEMLTGHPPFASLAPRALLAARMTQDPPPLTTVRPDVPVALAALVSRCLEREPAARPQSAAELIAALDDPSVVSGVFATPPLPPTALRRLRRPIVLGTALLVALILATAAAVTISRRTPPPATAMIVAPSPASVLVLPLVNINADSGNASLANAITNELAAALGRVRRVRVVSPTRAASMLKAGKTPNEIGVELHVALQLEGTVQREGNRIRVTARLVDVNDGVMRWADMYERDATDLFAVQEELSQAITAAVSTALDESAVPQPKPVARPAGVPRPSGAA